MAGSQAGDQGIRQAGEQEARQGIRGSRANLGVEHLGGVAIAYAQKSL